MKAITILPELRGVGGPDSFQRRFVRALSSRGVQVTHDLKNTGGAPILLINGIRNVSALRAAKRSGSWVVQRLGIPNFHRLRTAGIKVWIWAVLRNWLVSHIRRRYADVVIYQTRRASRIWNQMYGRIHAKETVIFNGIDLSDYSPFGRTSCASSRLALISVEGRQGIDPHMTLVRLSAALHHAGLDFEIDVFGKADNPAIKVFKQCSQLHYRGIVASANLPIVYRDHDCYVFTDHVTGACPNSLIEALACGVPVCGVPSEVLGELVSSEAQLILQSLVDGVGSLPKLSDRELAWFHKLMTSPEATRAAARRVACENYDLEVMTTRYLDALSTSDL